MFWGDESQPSWVEPPFVPGHEFLGRIAGLGDNVKGYELGERITVDQIAPCGECRFCSDGRYWMCQPHKNVRLFQGFLRRHGGICKDPDQARQNPPGSGCMALTDALLIEPYGCSKHCVDRAQIGSEDVVVISARAPWAWE